MYIKKRINDKYSKDSEVGKFKIASVSPPGLVCFGFTLMLIKQ